MNDKLEAFFLSYRASLEAHLGEEGESTFSRAYEFGRRALVAGLGILDMAVLHQEAVDSLGPRSRSGEDAARANAFFRELLSPFEMTLRGYREANQELQRANATLHRQREAIEAANRELESFSHSVSQDIRGPLQRIDESSLGVLEACGDSLPAEARTRLGQVRESARQVMRLTDGLLQLSLATRADLRRTVVDLTAMARLIAGRLQDAEPGRRVQFAAADFVRVEGDAKLLEVALENLLANAWKFTARREEARVELGWRADAGNIVYFVRDNGVGFDMGQAKNLFRPFHRLHSAAGVEGAGLGLATVQRIISRHGGKVWAEAQVDRGATFFFMLGKGSPG